jgi:hypothetical protein
MAKKQTPSTEATEATGSKNIVFLRSHPGYAYHPGNHAELADEHADLLIEGGFATLDLDEATTTETDETR